jgi:hypothetical protein
MKSGGLSKIAIFPSEGADGGEIFPAVARSELLKIFG